LRPGKPTGIVGREGGVESSSSTMFCGYMVYGCVGPVGGGDGIRACVVEDVLTLAVRAMVV
jgi:hypothetical protein